MPDPITMTGQYAYACDPYTQVRILCVDRPGDFPVVAMNDRGDLTGHKAMLHDSPNDYDLIPLQVVEAWAVLRADGESTAAFSVRAALALEAALKEIEK